jgi:hypothetical protein
VNLPQGTFLVADLNVRGELQLKAEYRYGDLQQVPGAAELIGQLSGVLWRSPEEFEEVLSANSADCGQMLFRWKSTSPTAGIASLRHAGELVSISLLAAGVHETLDSTTLWAFQQHLLRELRDTGFEPAFALTDLRERPLSATINFQPPPQPAQQRIAALADRCFAAAYFRYLGLA